MTQAKPTGAPALSLAPVVYFSEILARQGKSPPTLSNEQVREIYKRSEKLCLNEGQRGWVLNHLRVAFQVERWEDISPNYYPAILALIDSKERAIRQFYGVRQEMTEFFEKEILGGGTPWTPGLKAKLTRRLRQKVVLPEKVDWLSLAEDIQKLEAKGGEA
jgi:hypothetical protein